MSRKLEFEILYLELESRLARWRFVVSTFGGANLPKLPTELQWRLESTFRKHLERPVFTWDKPATRPQVSSASGHLEASESE